MTSSKNSGGFDMFPISSMIGYQFEKQYLSSGDFQALIEFIPAINSRPLKTPFKIFGTKK